ncbi:DinB family protein [Robertkochia solimangrovi]|uniref:DinB family protein n=1 Tax=Robertkochia solimangrovi TaxID=2213046 RepID=UPI00117CFFD4|nr:DinB family protein [Robertkochia solimangrovi]TRZ45211.1 DinB family protein [Robertkochia solimangrovi]
MKITLLENTEYANFYATYINALGNVELVPELKSRMVAFSKLMKKIPEEKMYYSYARNKWTLAELILHIIDAERIFQTRALWFARHGEQELPGFDQDDFVKNSFAARRTKESLLKEYLSVRESSIRLFQSFNDEALQFKGVANGSVMSVRAVGFIISGHQLHHEFVIKDKYLNS